MRGSRPIGRTPLIGAAEGRERDRKAEDYFDQSMEDLGVQGDERVLSVMSKIEVCRRRG